MAPKPMDKARETPKRKAKQDKEHDQQRNQKIPAKSKPEGSKVAKQDPEDHNSTKQTTDGQNVFAKNAKQETNEGKSDANQTKTPKKESKPRAKAAPRSRKSSTKRSILPGSKVAKSKRTSSSKEPTVEDVQDLGQSQSSSSTTNVVTETSTRASKAKSKPAKSTTKKSKKDKTKSKSPSDAKVKPKNNEVTNNSSQSRFDEVTEGVIRSTPENDDTPSDTSADNAKATPKRKVAKSKKTIVKAKNKLTSKLKASATTFKMVATSILKKVQLNRLSKQSEALAAASQAIAPALSSVAKSEPDVCSKISKHAAKRKTKPSEAGDGPEKTTSDVSKAKRVVTSKAADENRWQHQLCDAQMSTTSVVVPTDNVVVAVSETPTSTQQALAKANKYIEQTGERAESSIVTNGGNDTAGGGRVNEHDETLNKPTNQSSSALNSNAQPASTVEGGLPAAVAHEDSAEKLTGNAEMTQEITPTQSKRMSSRLIKQNSFTKEVVSASKPSTSKAERSKSVRSTKEMASTSKAEISKSVTPIKEVASTSKASTSKAASSKSVTSSKKAASASRRSTSKAESSKSVTSTKEVASTSKPPTSKTEISKSITPTKEVASTSKPSTSKTKISKNITPAKEVASISKVEISKSITSAKEVASTSKPSTSKAATSEEMITPPIRSTPVRRSMIASNLKSAPVKMNSAPGTSSASSPIAAAAAAAGNQTINANCNATNKTATSSPITTMTKEMVANMKAKLANKLKMSLQKKLAASNTETPTTEPTTVATPSDKVNTGQTLAETKQMEVPQLKSPSQEPKPTENIEPVVVTKEVAKSKVTRRKTTKAVDDNVSAKTISDHIDETINQVVNGNDLNESQEQVATSSNSLTDIEQPKTTDSDEKIASKVQRSSRATRSRAKQIETKVEDTTKTTQPEQSQQERQAKQTEDSNSNRKSLTRTKTEQDKESNKEASLIVNSPAPEVPQQSQSKEQTNKDMPTKERRTRRKAISVSSSPALEVPQQPQSEEQGNNEKSKRETKPKRKVTSVASSPAQEGPQQPQSEEQEDTSISVKEKKSKRKVSSVASSSSPEVPQQSQSEEQANKDKSTKETRPRRKSTLVASSPAPEEPQQTKQADSSKSVKETRPRRKSTSVTSSPAPEQPQQSQSEEQADKGKFTKEPKPRRKVTSVASSPAPEQPQQSQSEEQPNEPEGVSSKRRSLRRSNPPKEMQTSKEVSSIVTSQTQQVAKTSKPDSSNSKQKSQTSTKAKSPKDKKSSKKVSFAIPEASSALEDNVEVKQVDPNKEVTREVKSILRKSTRAKTTAKVETFETKPKAKPEPAPKVIDEHTFRKSTRIVKQKELALKAKEEKEKAEEKLKAEKKLKAAKQAASTKANNQKKETPKSKVTTAKSKKSKETKEETAKTTKKATTPRARSSKKKVSIEVSPDSAANIDENGQLDDQSLQAPILNEEQETSYETGLKSILKRTSKNKTKMICPSKGKKITFSKTRKVKRYKLPPGRLLRKVKRRFSTKKIPVSSQAPLEDCKNLKKKRKLDCNLSVSKKRKLNNKSSKVKHPPEGSSKNPKMLIDKVYQKGQRKRKRRLNTIFYQPAKRVKFSTMKSGSRKRKSSMILRGAGTAKRARIASQTLNRIESSMVFDNLGLFDGNMSLGQQILTFREMQQNESLRNRILNVHDTRVKSMITRAKFEGPLSRYPEDLTKMIKQGKLDLRKVLTRETFQLLPLAHQFALFQLLPPTEPIVIEEDHISLAVDALSHYQFQVSVREYQKKLKRRKSRKVFLKKWEKYQKSVRNRKKYNRLQGSRRKGPKRCPFNNNFVDYGNPKMFKNNAERRAKLMAFLDKFTSGIEIQYGQGKHANQTPFSKEMMKTLTDGNVRDNLQKPNSSTPCGAQLKQSKAKKPRKVKRTKTANSERQQSTLKFVSINDQSTKSKTPTLTTTIEPVASSSRDFIANTCASVEDVSPKLVNSSMKKINDIKQKDKKKRISATTTIEPVASSSRDFIASTCASVEDASPKLVNSSMKKINDIKQRDKKKRISTTSIESAHKSHNKLIANNDFSKEIPFYKLIGNLYKKVEKKEKPTQIINLEPVASSSKDFINNTWPSNKTDWPQNKKKKKKTNKQSSKTKPTLTSTNINGHSRRRKLSFKSKILKKKNAFKKFIKKPVVKLSKNKISKEYKKKLSKLFKSGKNSFKDCASGADKVDRKQSLKTTTQKIKSSRKDDKPKLTTTIEPGDSSKKDIVEKYAMKTKMLKKATSKAPKKIEPSKSVLTTTIEPVVKSKNDSGSTTNETKTKIIKKATSKAPKKIEPSKSMLTTIVEPVIKSKNDSDAKTKKKIIKEGTIPPPKKIEPSKSVLATNIEPVTKSKKDSDAKTKKKIIKAGTIPPPKKIEPSTKPKSVLPSTTKSTSTSGIDISEIFKKTFTPKPKISSKTSSTAETSKLIENKKIAKPKSSPGEAKVSDKNSSKASTKKKIKPKPKYFFDMGQCVSEVFTNVFSKSYPLTSCSELAYLSSTSASPNKSVPLRLSKAALQIKKRLSTLTHAQIDVLFLQCTTLLNEMISKKGSVFQGAKLPPITTMLPLRPQPPSVSHSGPSEQEIFYEKVFKICQPYKNDRELHYSREADNNYQIARLEHPDLLEDLENPYDPNYNERGEWIDRPPHKTAREILDKELDATMQRLVRRTGLNPLYLKLMLAQRSGKICTNFYLEKRDELRKLDLYDYYDDPLYQGKKDVQKQMYLTSLKFAERKLNEMQKKRPKEAETRRKVVVTAHDDDDLMKLYRKLSSRNG